MTNHYTEEVTDYLYCNTLDRGGFPEALMGHKQGLAYRDTTYYAYLGDAPKGKVKLYGPCQINPHPVRISPQHGIDRGRNVSCKKVDDPSRRNKKTYHFDVTKRRQGVACVLCRFRK